MYNLYQKIKISLPNRLIHLKAIFFPSDFVPPSVWLSEETIAQTDSLKDLGQKLGGLFEKYGSDKSIAHDYQWPYAYILDNLPFGPMLEVGIGSKNPIYPAAMVNFGTPGGSLRAWRASGYFKHCYGADIDEDVLFTENGITTHVVDQLSTASLDQIAGYLSDTEPEGFSFIVDDGFHNFSANINTFRSLRHLLAVGGFYVVEDMTAETLHSFLNVASEFNTEMKWSVWLNRGRLAHSYLLVLKKIRGAVALTGR